jgi:glycosyltransferase involved in cell wall biosynthesis
MSRPLRVCYFGVYGPAFPRNVMLVRGLRANGVEVVECRAPLELLPGHSKGAGVPGISFARVRYEARELVTTVRRIAHLAREAARIRGPLDAIVVAEFNQGLAPLAWLLAKRKRCALVADYCLSLWDTAVNDRKSLQPNRPRAVYRKALDRTGLLLSDVVLTETPATARWFDEQLAPGKVIPKNRVIHLGAPEWEFRPKPLPERGDRPLRVLYFGTWIPLHGVEFILDAAAELADDPRFAFTFTGKGQTRKELEERYAADPSGNVRWLGFVPQDELLRLIEEADICLGIFGTSQKARQVVSNKVWQCLASGRPVVTGDGPGAQSILRDGEHALLVPHGDGSAIAAALVRLADDEELAARLAANAARLVEEDYTSTGVGRQLHDIIAAAI